MAAYSAEAPTLIFAGTHARAENVRAHAHPCREFILVIEGECDVEAGPHTLHAGPGDLIRMPARLMHNQVSPGFISTVYLGFSAGVWEPPDPEVVHLPDPEVVRACMLLLARIHMHQTSACAGAASAMLLAVLSEADHQSQSTPRPRVPAQLQPVLRFLEQKLQDPLEVEDIAAFARMSASNLHKLFRQHLDTSPRRYLFGLRMERARRHLRDPYLTVKEVAGLCGYADVNLFVRAFRQAHGAPPHRWRRERGEAHAADPV